MEFNRTINIGRLENANKEVLSYRRKLVRFCLKKLIKEFWVIKESKLDFGKTKIWRMRGDSWWNGDIMVFMGDVNIGGGMIILGRGKIECKSKDVCWVYWWINGCGGVGSLVFIL